MLQNYRVRSFASIAPKPNDDGRKEEQNKKKKTYIFIYAEEKEREAIENQENR